MKVQIKRVYESAAQADGRILQARRLAAHCHTPVWRERRSA